MEILHLQKKKKVENGSVPVKKEVKQEIKKETESANKSDSVIKEDDNHYHQIPSTPAANFKGNTKDATRNMIQVKLCQAMGSCTVSGGMEPSVVATRIEDSMWKTYGSADKNYHAKFRTLFTNLKDDGNAGLRAALFSGNISADRLIQMSYEELANPAKKEERRKMLETTKEARMAGKAQASCTMFTCHKCQKNETTYYQLQTRSADEPMTTFVTCVYCGNHWKF